jgi:hypothetical protein
MTTRKNVLRSSDGFSLVDESPHRARAQELVENRESAECAVGDFYRALYRLRQSGEVQAEYDAITTLINMLQQDRLSLLKKFKDDIIF